MTALVGTGGLDNIRYAARNRLCAEIRYGDVTRIVEPYSLRLSRKGNTLLYAFELLKDGSPGEGLKSFHVAKIQAATITDSPFTPRYVVEL